MGWNALRGVVRNEERLLLSPVYTDDDLDLFTYHAVPHNMKLVLRIIWKDI